MFICCALVMSWRDSVGIVHASNGLYNVHICTFIHTQLMIVACSGMWNVLSLTHLYVLFNALYRSYKKLSKS